MKTIIFLRHGQTVSNKLQVLMGGLSDSPLTEEGVETSKAIGNLLQTLPIDVVYCSPNTRAQDTLGYALPDSVNDAKIVESLREQSFGSRTGTPLDEIPAEVNAQYFADPYGFKHTDGESLRDLQERVGIFLREVVELQGLETILLVTHENVIRAAVGYMKDLDLEICSLKFTNATLTAYSYESGKYSALYFNRKA